MTCIARIAIPLALFAAFATAQPSPSRGPLMIDLRSGNIFDLGTTPPTRTTNTYVTPYATVQTQANRACPETPFMARLDMNLNPPGLAPASRSFITVAYEGPSTREPRLPTGWVTHIADDIANDGFGGGSGLAGVAEVQVLDQNLAAYTTALAAGVVDRIAYQELRLAKGSMRYEVANQYFGWGQPANEIGTGFGKKMFAIGPPGADSRIFVGLNRVIGNNASRTGCGARWALIEFQ